LDGGADGGGVRNRERRGKRRRRVTRVLCWGFERNRPRLPPNFYYLRQCFME